MVKVIKYKFLNTIEDRKFLIMTIIYMLYLNYEILKNSGILTVGGREFNSELKYSLLVNNFKIVSISFGLIIAIYLGISIIGKDIETNHMYIILTSIGSRKKYFFLTWLGTVFIIVFLQVILGINFLCVNNILDIPLNYSEFFNLHIEILINMIVVMSITSVFSINMGNCGGVIGLFSLVIFNLHTYLTIPFANEKVELPQNVRRFFINIAPIKDAAVPSVVKSGFEISLQTPSPFIINNFTIYQLVFIIIILVIGIEIFQRKEL